MCFVIIFVQLSNLFEVKTLGSVSPKKKIPRRTLVKRILLLYHNASEIGILGKTASAVSSSENNLDIKLCEFCEILQEDQDYYDDDT